MLPAVSSGVAFPAFWQGSGWGRLPAGLAFHRDLPERLRVLPEKLQPAWYWGSWLLEDGQESSAFPAPVSGSVFNAALAWVWSWEAAFSSHSLAVARFFSTPKPCW